MIPNINKIYFQITKKNTIQTTPHTPTHFSIPILFKKKNAKKQHFKLNKIHLISPQPHSSLQ